VSSSNKVLQPVALVTGAASGMGRAMALGLLQNGYRVLALDVQANALKELADGACNEASLRTLTLDLTEVDAEALAAEALAQFGRVDILVNNAGIGMNAVRTDYHYDPVRFWEVTPQMWNTALAVNATAVFLLSRAFVRPMIERGWGRIINVTTSLGTMLRSGYVPYGSTKSCAEALSAQIAGDLEGTGVTCNVMTPGAVVDTGMLPATAPYDRGALVRPDVLMAPLLWLCSRDADQVNGQRYVGVKFDSALSAGDAASAAGAPIGWKGIAALPAVPGSKLY
jgi:NAD(P)-dependent dehydrogenase (short-subunit alcohol dehydrogenase family)